MRRVHRQLVRNSGSAGRRLRAFIAAMHISGGDSALKWTDPAGTGLDSAFPKSMPRDRLLRSGAKF
jgi:hypothetical protein